MKIFKFLVAIFMAFMGVVGTIGSLIAMKLSGITLLILLILQLTGLISIGWMVLGYPAIMFFGGMALFGLNILITAISLAVLADK